MFCSLVRHRPLWVLPLAQSYSYPFRFVTIHNAICSLDKIPPEAVCATLLRRLLRRPRKAEQIPVQVRTMFAPSTSNILQSPFCTLYFFCALSFTAPYQAGAHASVPNSILYVKSTCEIAFFMVKYIEGSGCNMYGIIVIQTLYTIFYQK